MHSSFFHNQIVTLEGMGVWILYYPVLKEINMFKSAKNWQHRVSVDIYWFLQKRV